MRDRFVLLSVVLGLVSVVTSGCLPIPHRVVHEPALQFFVMDTAGRPIKGATAYIWSSDRPNDRIRSGRSYPTNDVGDAEPGGNTNWHFGWWLIPGIPNSRHFAWCVAAPGFTRASGRLQSGRPDTIRVRLAPSPGEPDCDSSGQTLEDIAPRNAPSSRIAVSPASSDLIVKITGCVIDQAQGGPIDRASVRLLRMHMHSSTSNIGSFTLPVSPANLPDTLVISHPDYADYQRAVPAMRTGSLRLGDVKLRSMRASNSGARASKEARDLVERCRKAR